MLGSKACHFADFLFTNLLTREFLVVFFFRVFFVVLDHYFCSFFFFFPLKLFYFIWV